MIEIRLIQESETGYIKKIDQDTWDMIYFATKWNVMRNVRLMLDDGKIVAMAFYNITKYRDYVNLFYIITLKEYRKMGYGKRFIAEIMKAGKEVGKKYLIFKCKKTREEKNFYDKLGFTPISQEGEEFIYKIEL